MSGGRGPACRPPDIAHLPDPRSANISNPLTGKLGVIICIHFDVRHPAVRGGAGRTASAPRRATPRPRDYKPRNTRRALRRQAGLGWAAWPGRAPAGRAGSAAHQALGRGEGERQFLPRLLEVSAGEEEEEEVENTGSYLAELIGGFAPWNGGPWRAQGLGFREVCSACCQPPLARRPTRTAPQHRPAHLWHVRSRGHSHTHHAIFTAPGSGSYS